MSSRQIEENVVKMRFDNSEFDDNVKASNDSIDKFKTTLSTLPTQIYIGISNAISRISLSDIIGVGAALAGVQMVKNGITMIGYEMTNVARMGMNAINSLINQAVNQINQGGKARALNIANAKFQLEGLKLDVETFMEAADYAVSGTAYGLDAAAKVASQMGASGITQLEDLKKALRGVSGVAAMTNSSYEEIGHIFTTIAGNGRLMTEQLNSFSYKGLNVASELGKALGKTEAEIRDMVSKGQLDFKTFAMAMDDAFGEHAKDANKTFEGAMSNVRAALSRVGEGIWTPIIQNAVEVFNQLRLAINAFKAELTDNNVYEVFGQTIKSVFDTVAGMIKLVRYAIQETSIIEELSYTFKDFFIIVKEIFDALSIDYGFVMNEIIENISTIILKVKQVIWAIKEAFEETIGIRKVGAEFNNILVYLSRIFLSLEQINDLEMKEVFASWFKGLKSVFDTITKVLGLDYRKLPEMFSKAVGYIFEMFKSLKLSDERIDKITRTFKGAASVLDVIKMLVISVAKFIMPVFDYIPTVVDWLLIITATIGDWLYYFRNLVKEAELFDKIFDGIAYVLVLAKDTLGNIGKNFFEAFFGDGSQDLSFLEKIKKFLHLIWDTISEAFTNFTAMGIDLSPLQEFINNLVNFALGTNGDTGNAEKGMTVIEKFFSKVKEVFSGIGSFFSDKILTIFTGENDTFNKIVEFSGSIGEGIKDVVMGVSDAFVNLGLSDVEGLALAALIWHAMDVVKEIVIALIGGVADVVKSITITLNGNEVVIALLQKILDKYFGEKTIGLFDRIKMFMEDIKAINLPAIIHGEGQAKEAQIMTSLAEVLKGFAWAFISIAASLFIIALIPVEKLNPAVDVLLKFITVIAIISGIFMIVGSVMQGFSTGLVKVQGIMASVFPNSAASPLTALASAFKWIGVSLVLISASLYIISKIEADKLSSAVAVLMSFTVVFTAIFLLFSMLRSSYVGENITKLGKAFTNIGLALLLMSAGIALISMSFKAGEESKLIAIGALIVAVTAIVGLIMAMVLEVSQASAQTALVAGAAILMSMIGFIGIVLAIAGAVAVLSMFDTDKVVVAGIIIGVLTLIVTGMTALIIALAIAAGEVPQALAAIALIDIFMLQLAAVFAAIALIVAAGAGFVAAVAFVVKTFKEFIEFLAELDGEKADKFADNIEKILGAIATAIPKAILRYYVEAIKTLKELFPSITNFVVEDLLPFLAKTLGLVYPQMITTTLKGLTDFLNAIFNSIPLVFDLLDMIFFGTSDNGVFKFICDELDKLWNHTVEWLKDRIPVVVPDMIELALLFITTLNLAMEDKWDLFDVELQKLIDNSIKLMKDLLTGNKTLEDIDDMITTIFEHIRISAGEHEDELREMFSAIGAAMASALVGSLADGLPDDGILGGVKEWLSGAADNISKDTFGSGSSHNKNSLLDNINSSDYPDLDFSKIPSNIQDYLPITPGNINNDNPFTGTKNVGNNPRGEKLDLNITLDASPNMGKYYNDLKIYDKQLKFAGY